MFIAISMHSPPPRSEHFKPSIRESVTLLKAPAGCKYPLPSAASWKRALEWSPGCPEPGFEAGRNPEHTDAMPKAPSLGLLGVLTSLSHTPWEGGDPALQLPEMK